VKGLLVLGKAFSFAGGAGTKTSASSTSQAPQSLERERSQKERRSAARRKRLQIFRSSGLATKDARRGIEEGHSRNARVLHSTPSAPKGSGFRASGDRAFPAHRGMTASSETDRPPTQENAGSVRGATIRCG